jgi:hypothetical protein
MRFVQSKEARGRMAGRSEGHKQAILYAKVSGPRVAARMKELDESAAYRIDAGDVATLMPVAENASKSEVRCLSCAPVLLRNHVIDFVRSKGVRLWVKTVLAAAFCTGVHQTPQRRGDPRPAHRPSNRRRAVAFAIRTRCSTYSY